MQKFPKTVAIAWDEGDVRDPPFMVVEANPEEFADIGQKKKVGIYRLEKIVTVEGKAEVK